VRLLQDGADVAEAAGAAVAAAATLNLVGGTDGLATVQGVARTAQDVQQAGDDPRATLQTAGGHTADVAGAEPAGQAVNEALVAAAEKRGLPLFRHIGDRSKIRTENFKV